MLVGLIAYNYPEIFSMGYESILDALNNKLELKLMLILVVLKIVASSLTLSAGGSGGVFTPSLFLGAMLGGSYGFMINTYFPEYSASYGAYALVGMAAMFAATSRATFTAIVILFEMTSDYSIILPLMLTCVIATEISMVFSKHSIYSLKLARKGLRMVIDFGVNIIDQTSVEHAMSKDLICLNAGDSIAATHDRLQRYPHKLYPVIGNNKNLMGTVRFEKIESVYQNENTAAEELFVEDFVNTEFEVATEGDSVHHALANMKNSDETRLLIKSKKTGDLIGILSSSDIVKLVSKKEKP